MSERSFLIDRLEKWEADPNNGLNANGRTRRLLKEAAAALRHPAPEPRNCGEPDAWQWRCNGSDWHFCDPPTDEELEKFSHEFRALYLSAPLSRKAVEALKPFAGLVPAAFPPSYADDWEILLHGDHGDAVASLRVKHFRAAADAVAAVAQSSTATTASAEPVADWQMRHKHHTREDQWFHTQAPHSDPDKFDYRPLYASPPPPAGTVHEVLAFAVKYLRETEDHMMKHDIDQLMGDLLPPSVVADKLESALSSPAPIEAGWRDISTAPKGEWIIGYTSWGQHVGKFHEWVGPCEWVSDHHEFSNTDFDVFPSPTHWHPMPAGPIARKEGGTHA